MIWAILLVIAGVLAEISLTRNWATWTSLANIEATSFATRRLGRRAGKCGGDGERHGGPLHAFLLHRFRFVPRSLRRHRRIGANRVWEEAGACPVTLSRCHSWFGRRLGFRNVFRVRLTRLFTGREL